MSARPKTSDNEIVEAARQLLERKGPDGFSMKEIADLVGIKAPSLYKRFKDRAELLDRVEITLWGKLRTVVEAAVNVPDARQALRAYAHAGRTFAKTHPNGYSLMMSERARHSEEGHAARAAAFAPCLPAFIALAGENDALLAGRVLVPFVHGFIDMELSQAFRFGGEIDEAFEHGVDTIIKGLNARGLR